MKYIEYDESLHGKLSYPDGFCNLLEGLSLEDQLDFFRIGNGVYLNEDFSKRRSIECHYSKTIDNEDRVKEIIVRDNMIAGVMVKNCYGKLVPCLPERGFIIRDDSEIDGSGYKEFKLYLYLICVTKDFDSNWQIQFVGWTT